MMPDHLSKCVRESSPVGAAGRIEHAPRLPAALWDADQRKAFAMWCGAVLGAGVEWGPERGDLRKRDLLVFDSVTIAAMIRGLVATFEGASYVRVLRCEVPPCD